jgi:peptide/nickel transport system permease protein
MWRYLVRRLLSGLVMLFAVTLLTFAIFRLIPFTPACIIVPCGPGSTTTDAQIRAAEHKLGTDRPVPVQYAKFVWGIFGHGTFGRSWTGGSIDDSLRAALPQTTSVLLGGIVVLLLLAIPLAALSALRAQTAVDRAILLFAILGIALHPLLLGVGLVNVFSGYLHILPFGSYCHLLPVKHQPPSTTFVGPPGGATAFGSQCGGPLVWAQHMVLPWLTFALFFLPLYTRMIRARFLETMDAQYVVAARGRGVPELRLIRSHALRPALLPLVTMIGLDLGGALMAVIYIESIYGLSGLGTLLRAGIANPVTGSYDLPVIAAVFFVVAAFTIFVTFVVDILYAWLDPRVRAA